MWPMIISFKNKKIQKIFNSGKLLNNKYEKNAKSIKRRMAVLMASDNLRNVPVVKPESCHPLKGEKKGLFAVDLTHPFRLVFAPNHEPVPKMKDGGIDLAKITSITIINVEDYH